MKFVIFQSTGLSWGLNGIMKQWVFISINWLSQNRQTQPRLSPALLTPSLVSFLPFHVPGEVLEKWAQIRPLGVRLYWTFSQFLENVWSALVHDLGRGGSPSPMNGNRMIGGKNKNKNINRSIQLQPPWFKIMNVMYPAQTYLKQNKFAFLCWEEAEMRLAGSWCHQHHLYVLKWITDKGFALLQEKGPNVFAFKYRIKWNAYSQCGTSFWLPVWRRRAEKSRLYPPKLSLFTTPPLFLFVIEANETNCWKFLWSPECLNGDSHWD